MALQLQGEPRVGGEPGDVLWTPDTTGAVDIDELLSSWNASNDPSSAVDQEFRSDGGLPASHSAQGHSAASSHQPGSSSLIHHHEDTADQAGSFEDWFQEFVCRDTQEGSATAGGDSQTLDRLAADAGAAALLLDELQSLPSCDLPDPFITASTSFRSAGVQAESGASGFSLLLDGFEPWEASCESLEPCEEAWTRSDDEELEALSTAGGGRLAEGAPPGVQGAALRDQGQQPSLSSEECSEVGISSSDIAQGAGLQPISEHIIQTQTKPRHDFVDSGPPPHEPQPGLSGKTGSLSHKPQAELVVPSRASPGDDCFQAPGNPSLSASGVRGQAPGQPTPLALRLAAVVRGLSSTSSGRLRQTTTVHSARPAPLSGSTRANASYLCSSAEGLYTPATTGSEYNTGFSARLSSTGHGPEESPVPGDGGAPGVGRCHEHPQEPLWSGFSSNDFAVTKGVTTRSNVGAAAPRPSAEVPLSTGVALGAPVGMPEAAPAVGAPTAYDFPVTAWSTAQGRRRRANSDVYAGTLKRDTALGSTVGMGPAGVHWETGAGLLSGRRPRMPTVSQSQVVVRSFGTAGNVVSAPEGKEEEEEGILESELFRLGLLTLTRRYRRHTGGMGGSSGSVSNPLQRSGSRGWQGDDEFCLTYALSASPPASLELDSALLPPRPSNPALRKRAQAQLIELATAYAADQPLKVRVLSQRLQKVASPHGCATQKLVHYMLRALELRREGKGMQAAAPHTILEAAGRTTTNNGITQANIKNFVNVTGWSAFAEILNTHTVIGALRGHSKVHIVLLSEWASLCWPALLRDLARQPGGAPSVRVTSIDFLFPDTPPPGTHGAPEEAPPGSSAPVLGEELRRCADALGVPLVYQPLQVPHVAFHPGLVRADPSEAVAVVSAWHLMIFPDSQVLKSNPRNAMLKWIHSLSPQVFILIEGDADFNGQFFIPRVKELLMRGITVFEAFDSRIPEGDPSRAAAEFLLAQDVTNCIACEGLDRFLRMERAEQWGDRLSSVGFKAAKFAPQVWDSLKVFSGIDSRIGVTREGEVARLLWLGTPHVFGSAWVPG